jgi:hypothetical protein
VRELDPIVATYDECPVVTHEYVLELSWSWEVDPAKVVTILGDPHGIPGHGRKDPMSEIPGHRPRHVAPSFERVSSQSHRPHPTVRIGVDQLFERSNADVVHGAWVGIAR